MRYNLPLCFNCRLALQNRGYDVIRRSAYSEEKCLICGNVGPYGLTEIVGDNLEDEPLIKGKLEVKNGPDK